MSKYAEKIKKWYPHIWNLKMVRNAVEKGKITAEEFKEITGEQYAESTGN